MKFLTILLTLSLISCASSQPKSDVEVGPTMSDVEYRTLLEKNTKAHQAYEGFYNTLEVRAVFMNSNVQAAILQKTAETMQWDTKNAQAEREKMFQQNSNSTKFFASFFVPTQRLNRLHKPESVWKIYLEANGERYEGKATKRTEPLEILQAMYPAHSRWAVPYDITFPVPLGVVDNSSVKLIFTSSVAKAELIF